MVKKSETHKIEKSQRFEMMVSTAFLKAIDQWRLAQPDPPSRAAAIRQLAQLGLMKDQLATTRHEYDRQRFEELIKQLDARYVVKAEKPAKG